MESEDIKELVTALHEAGYKINKAEKNAKKRKMVITVSHDTTDAAPLEPKILTSCKNK
ncbi:MAG: hypothetical protein LBH73_05240 [Spirochaetaceae bacterium]|jgi:hypothetical protein|nr:hypothetical protein [Spirochaetaceae bacterium]